MDEEQLDFGGNSPLKMEEESAESVEAKQETTADASAAVDQPQGEEAKKEDEEVKVEEGTGADRWARRARSPQAFPGGRGDGEQSSGWRSSGRFRETDEATSSHTRDEHAPPPTGPSRRDPPTGPSRRVPPPPPAPHTDSIRPADSRLPKGASFQPGTPPPNRTVYLYRLHIPQGSSRFGAALIGPSGSIQKELLRAANLLTFTIEPRFNRYADLCGSKRSVQRGLKLIRDMAEKHMGDEVGKGKFAELDESRLETWPGAWLEDRFVGPENGDDEDVGQSRGAPVGGSKAGNGRGRSRERNGVEQDEFGRSRRPPSADRSPSPPSRRPSPPRRSRSPSRRHSNRDRSLSPRRRSPSPPRSSRRPSVSNDPPRGTFRSSDAPPPHRTCLRLNTTFPIRKVGGVFYGPNGTMLDRFRDAVGLVSFEIRMTQALYAIAVLVGSEGAIRRGLSLIERVTYEETSAAWNNWEKNKLSDRGWVRFRRQDVLVEEGLWLEEKFSDPADGPPNEQLPPPPFLPGAGPRDLAFADMHLPGVEPPQAKFGGGGGGGGIRGRYRDPSPPRSGSGRAGERWGRDGGRDEDRWASGSGSARGGGGRMESDNGWGRRAERGRDRSRSRSRDRRRSPSPLSSRRSRRDSDAGRSSRRSPSPSPRRSRRDSDASRSSRRRSPVRERSRSRSRSRDRLSSRREKRARSPSRERSVRGASPEKKRRMSMKEENKEVNGGNSIVRVIPIPNSAAPKFLGGSPNVVVIEDLSGCTISLVSSSTSNSVRLEGPDQSSIDQALADVQRVVERVEKGWKLPSSGGQEGKKERRRSSRSGDDESDRVKRRKTEEQSPATARSSRASPSPLSPLRPSPPPPPSATRSKSSLAESD